MGRLKPLSNEKGFLCIPLYIIQNAFKSKKVVITTLFGKRLREMRKKRGMRLQEMADKLGVAKSTYAGYESGYRQPDLQVLAQTAEILKTSADYLLGLTDNPYPKEPTRNLKELLKENDLHWDGVPLTDEELKPLCDILELIVRHRLPKVIETR
jgi:transcriptional regulator with XRE-family HTH domain